jgi:hypothetical protein
MNLRHTSYRLFAAACAASLLAASTAMAQSSMFGSGSVSNRNSMGGMTSPSSGFSGMGGMGGLGGMGGGFGGMGGGFGGMGSGMGGGMGNGFGGMGGNSGFGGMGGMGNNRGGTGAGFGNMGNAQGGFVGRNANANQFIGMNQNTGGNGQGMNGLQSLMGGQGGNRGLGGLGSRGANPAPNNFDQNQNPQGQSQQPSLRARQKIAFSYPKPRVAGIHTQVQQRFGKLTDRNVAMKNVRFATEGSGTVVLRGQVASQADARLAEKLVRLEPGVKSVRSELTFPAPAVEE